MRKLLLSVAAGAMLGCAACGSNAPEAPQAPGDDRIVGKDWQVVSIYTAPDAASTVPESLVDVPQISFGESSLVGSSGCAQFRGHVSYHGVEERTNIREADTLRLDEIVYDTPKEDCEGAAGWTDGHMRNLMATGHEFSIRMNPNNQLVLTLRTDAIDSPALRMVSL